MAISTKRQTAIMMRKIFEMLVEHPEGLSTRDIWDGLQSLPLEHADGRSRNGWVLPTFDEASFHCVAPIRAGWLRIHRHHWTLSDEGKQAYFRYPNPKKLMIEAGRRSTRGWLSVHLPRSYSFAGKVKDQLTSEFMAARRIGFRRLFRETFAASPPWQEVLPLQAPRRIALSLPDFDHYESFLEYLDSLGVYYGQGGHAIYLPPGSLKHPAFQLLTDSYPADAGVKIVKNPGGVDETGYVSSSVKGDSMLHLKLVHGHRQLTLVANLLYSKGLGPRLYDLLELQCGGQLWTAYVVEHISGGTPTMAECEAGVENLRSLEKEGLLRVIPPEGFDDEEFGCPTCVGNAQVDDHRQFKYIDFQNFFLDRYESFLTTIAVEAADKSHFGDKSVLRGGKYLYQTVPGVRLPGKRGVNERIAILNRLMESSAVSIKDRLVLDVGCNIGMMMGQYLKAGAKWCHGWDRAYVTPHTEKLLLALGCTRFSTTGGDISESQDLEADLEGFLSRDLDGCVISYLAVRAHLGWLQALGRIPWYFLIYEGHEGERREDFENDLNELKRIVNFKIGAFSEYVDGDSDPRTIAILTRAAH